MNETLECIDSSFDKSNLAKYHLSVQFSSDYISVCVNEVKTSNVVCLWQQHFPNSLLSTAQEFQNRLEQCPFAVNNTYRSVSFSVVNSNYTFIPSALFQEENLQEYVTMNCGEMMDVTYYANAHSALSLVVGFALPNVFSEYIKSDFPQAKIWQHSSLLLFSVFRDFKQMDEEQLFVHYKNNQLEVLFFSKGAFKFGNSFSVLSPEDFIYYLLFSCQQLQINPEKVKLILLGEIKLDSEFHRLIYTYFQKIQFGSIQSKLKTSLSLNDIPKHFFYTLFNQFLCE